MTRTQFTQVVDILVGAHTTPRLPATRKTSTPTHQQLKLYHHHARSTPTHAHRSQSPYIGPELSSHPRPPPHLTMAKGTRQTRAPRHNHRNIIHHVCGRNHSFKSITSYLLSSLSYARVALLKKQNATSQSISVQRSYIKSIPHCVGA